MDCGIYLPAYGKCFKFVCSNSRYGPTAANLIEQVTIYFLKDLISGKKKKIYGKDVRHVTIPQYENLTIEAISNFVTQYGEVEDYLPDAIEIPKIPK